MLIPVSKEIYEKSRLRAQLIHRNAFRLFGEDDGALKEMHLKVSYSKYGIELIFCKTEIRVPRWNGAFRDKVQNAHVSFIGLCTRRTLLEGISTRTNNSRCKAQKIHREGVDAWEFKGAHVKFIPGGVWLLISTDNHDIPFLSVLFSKDWKARWPVYRWHKGWIGPKLSYSQMKRKKRLYNMAQKKQGYRKDSLLGGCVVWELKRTRFN